VLAAFKAERDLEVLTLQDQATGSVRRAALKGGRLQQVLFLTEHGRLPPRDWLVGLFGLEALGAQDRITLLAGRPAAPMPDTGPLVCACRRVGAATIARAAAAGACDLDAIGAATGAGVTCGSCRPEISRLIADARPAPAEGVRNAA
jgi:assimilatory nitrate reductase catalytic subunit